MENSSFPEYKDQQIRANAAFFDNQRLPEEMHSRQAPQGNRQSPLLIEPGQWKRIRKQPQSSTPQVPPGVSLGGFFSPPRINLFNDVVHTREIISDEEMLATIPMKTLKAITQPKEMKNIRIRIFGAVFVVAFLFYVPWLVSSINTAALWLSIPFLTANLYTTFLVLITIFNNWHRSAPYLYRLAEGSELKVAVLIPTYGEPADMLRATIESVLHQNWALEKLVIIVGDDGRRIEVKVLVEGLQKMYPSTQIIYHLPPPKNTPERKGSAKDGNLNSMLDLITRHFPKIKYIETRDADDIVGDPDFLRYTVGHLVSSPKTAYVQTIKEAKVSPGDPFGNMQTLFYRSFMLSKNAANAVFPCGSGLVWRKEHLDMIGGFPSWNLVEDLYSGYVAMQYGFKNAYLPITGAVGQTAPEDVPNVYKQLGTWALDSFRLFVWKNPWFVKGLTFKQRLQFTETCLFYFLSLSLFLIACSCIFSLISGIQPVVSSPLDYILHCWLYAVLFEILFLNLGTNIPYKSLWRSREMCFGMMFVYIKACFLAIFYGPNKKPVYKVTRKDQQAGFYLRETLPQTILLLALIAASCYQLYLHQDGLVESDFGSLFWAAFYIAILVSFIRKSWFGVGRAWAAKRRAKKRRRQQKQQLAVSAKSMVSNKKGARGKNRSTSIEQPVVNPAWFAQMATQSSGVRPMQPAGLTSNERWPAQMPTSGTIWPAQVPSQIPSNGIIWPAQMHFQATGNGSMGSAGVVPDKAKPRKNKTSKPQKLAQPRSKIQRPAQLPRQASGTLPVRPPNMAKLPRDKMKKPPK